MTYVQDGEKSFSIEDHKYVVIEPEIVHSERYKNYEDESGKGALIMAIGFTLDGGTPLPTCEVLDAWSTPYSGNSPKRSPFTSR